MIAIVDVYYESEFTRTAVVLIQYWEDECPVREYVHEQAGEQAEYIPGRFYERELPCILSTLEQVEEDVGTIVIDGYVFLDSDGRKGLGAILHEAINESIPVIGVAKKHFFGSNAIEILRGNSRNPLYVTSVGCNLNTAAKHIRSMQGEHRIPTILKLADQLSRNKS